MKRYVLLSTHGIGLIEVVVSTALLVVIFVGFLGVLQLGTRLATDNKSRTSALSLSLERMEYIHSLKYSYIGTVGGNPAGNLVVSEPITLNGVHFTRRTYIVYVDDPKDGLGASDTNGITNDYKRIKVETSWVGPKGISRKSSLVSDITPLLIEQ